MSDITLLVFEGEKTEPKLFANINRTFFQHEHSTKLYASFKSDIYSLWNILKRDPDLDLLEVVKEKNKDKAAICALDRHRVSQIFLFFDYDGQVPGASDDDLAEMIEFFNEETDHGKLFISYPMVEAIKDYNLANDAFFRNCTVAAKIKIGYKGIVAARTGYQDTDTIQPADWEALIDHGLKKTRCLIFHGYEYPTMSEYEQMNQRRILNAQITEYIDPSGIVSVISGLPLFIVDYFGFNQYAKLFG